jgi:hypothetical protein
MLLFIVYQIITLLNKGFELSDESYYCLASQNPFDTRIMNSAFGLINYRFTFGHTGIFELRVFKFIFQSIALAIFAISFIRYFLSSGSWQFKTSAFLVILVTGFFNYDYLPMTMSYNSWSLVLSLVFWSCFLFNVPHNKRYVSLNHVIIGIVLIFSLYNKFPNAILMFLFYFGYLIIFLRKNLISFILAGGLGAILGFFVLFGNITNAKKCTSELLNYLSGVGHTSSSRYFFEVGDLFTNMLGIKFLLIQVALICLMYLIRKKGFSYWLGLVLIAANSLFCFKYIRGNSAEITNDFLTVVILGFCAVAAIVLFYNKNQLRVEWRNWYILIFLFLSPFAMAAGTSNVIFYTASHFSVYFACVIIALLLLTREPKIFYFYSFFALMISFFTCSFIFNGMVKTPYRQTALNEKKIPLLFSEDYKNICENEERYELLCTLSEKLTRYNNQNLLVMASPPCLGTVLLANMKPFAVCWLADPEKDADVNDAYFSAFDFRKEKPFLLISSEITNSKRQRSVFEKHGLGLENYKLCDSVYIRLNERYYYYYRP